MIIYLNCFNFQASPLASNSSENIEGSEIETDFSESNKSRDPSIVNAADSNNDLYKHIKPMSVDELVNLLIEPISRSDIPASRTNRTRSNSNPGSSRSCLLSGSSASGNESVMNRSTEEEKNDCDSDRRSSGNDNDRSIRSNDEDEEDMNGVSFQGEKTTGGNGTIEVRPLFLLIV